MEWWSAAASIIAAIALWYSRNTVSLNFQELITDFGIWIIPLAAAVLFAAARLLSAPFYVWKLSPIYQQCQHSGN